MAKATAQRKEYLRCYYQENKASMDARMVRWRDQKRLEFINQLGGKCVHCEEDNPIVLDFDHINDDGADHRRSTGGVTIVRYLSKHGVNKEQFQLLCKNCNWIKEYKRRKNAKRQQKAA